MVKFTKVFLDSNVIFSALYSKLSTPAEVLYLGAELEIRLLISSQVELEVFRNLKLKIPGIVAEFQHLLEVGALTVVDDAPATRSRKWSNFLSTADASILESAIFYSCDCLVTGNTKDFTKEIEEVSGMVILTPRDFVLAVKS